MLTWTLIVLTLFKISNFRENWWERQCVVMRERRFIWNYWKINDFLEDKTRLIEVTSSQSFFEHFKRMLRKSWLINELKSRDNYVVLNETSCIIWRDFIFASDDSWQSNLNFRTKALIKSLLRRLKISSRTLTFFLLLICSADIFKKLIRFSSFKECKIISNDSSFMLIEFIRAARWKNFFKKSLWSERFTTKTEIDIIILSMLIETASHTLKNCARSSMTFIIIMLIFWHIDSWTISINRLNMQLTSASLLNIVLILIFSIITFTIEQTTMYMRRKKITRIT